MARSKQKNPKAFYTTSEVADYCSVSNDGVLKWIKSGKLRAFSTPGGHYRVSREDFIDFLKEYEIPVDDVYFYGVSSPLPLFVVSGNDDIAREIEKLLESMTDPPPLKRMAAGYEAAIRIGMDRPSIVILDTETFDLNAVSFITEVKACEHTSQTLFLTICAQPDEIKSLYNAGADLCLLKPIQSEHYRLELMRLYGKI